MTRKIKADGKIIEYELSIKSVKNINLRIKPDGKVYVSANRWVSKKAIDNFVASKADLIFRALKKYAEHKEVQKVQYYTESELRELIVKFCEEVYPHFEKRGVEYPQIKFRKMVSRWGSCHWLKGVVTFNTNLVYAPVDCIEYVVCHEFTHFLEPNHSAEFYEELACVCSDYKERRKKLKEIKIR